MIQNKLLSKPPKAAHRLQDTRDFRRLFGRPPREDDYDGVHTTSNRMIAAAYAMSAWDGDPNSYPVIVTLDVGGLQPLPDVDAMLRGAEAIRDALPVYRKMVEEAGWTIDDAIEDDDYREADAGVGDPPAAFIFEGIGYDVARAISDYAESADLDRDKLWDRFIEKGELPDGAITRLVEQQRYLSDFDLDRVVRIEAIKPWWHRVLLGDDDGEEDEEIRSIEARGFTVFTIGDWPFTSEGPTRVLWEAPGADERAQVEYHGTTGRVVEQAFPGLIPKRPPFSVSE